MEVATINHCRVLGARFGVELAKQARRNANAGMTQQRNRKIILEVCDLRKKELRQMGGVEKEIEIYVREAWRAAAAYAALDGELLAVVLGR